MRKLLTCGANRLGQLGLGDVDDGRQALALTSLPGGAVASQVACGREHTWVLCEGGRLFSCGSNTDGQLSRKGDGSTLQAVDLSGLDGAMASQVACGSLHTWVLCTDGRLLSCGGNAHGQLGLVRI